MKSELINVRPDARKESNGCNGTLEREEWRDVVGYEGLYQVSSFGRVKALARSWVTGNGGTNSHPEKIMCQQKDHNGYPFVGLCKKGTQKFKKVHRLVMEAFVPNPDNLPVINHRNEVKTANYPDNMEWCDAKYNTNYGSSRKRAAEKFRGFRHSAESIEKMRLANLGRKHSEETKDKWRQIRSQKEYILRQRESRRKYMKPVIQFDKANNFLKEWDSIRSVERDLGISHQSVSQCCKGIIKTSGGFKWKYKSDYENEQRQ